MSEETQVRLDDATVEKKVTRVAELEEVLKDEVQKPRKGFRKLLKKSKEQMEAEYQKLNQELAAEFLIRYNAIVKQFGIEVRAVMEVNRFNPNVAQAVTRLQPYREKQNKTKPWSEAMADNLRTRGACKHVLHDEGNVCEKCGLNPENWGLDNKGVTQTYFENMSKKIAEEKQKEEEKEA